MPMLTCTHVETETRMFTPGADYKATECGWFGSQFLVTDDLGHQRIIGKDSLRFIVGHRKTKIQYVDSPLYAYFQIR